LHNLGQVIEIAVVEFMKTGDKQVSSAEGEPMARSGPLPTEAQWKKIAPLLAKPPKQCKGGRPWIQNRHVLEGILWILRNGARWQDLPGVIPTSFDVLAAAAGLGGAGRLVKNLACVSERVKRVPAIEVERIVSGRQFCSCEKRGYGVGKTKRGKGTKWMVVVDGHGLPLGNYLHPASPAEIKLAETTPATIRVGRSHQAGRPRQKPLRVIADKAYDSDPLRKRLRQHGIELICPHKKNRVRPATQDGRALRRHRRRWIVERTNAWLRNFRRLVVRYDRSLTIFGAFFHIACFMIVLRRVVQ
jgi:transposase